MTMSDLSRQLDFLRLVGHLKHVKRTGWVRRGIPEAESVADHSFRVALFALALANSYPAQIDRNKCIAMAVVHDLAESIVGDIAPSDGFTQDEKNRKEEAAMSSLAATLDDPSLLAMWHEYEQGATAEAQFVRALDKLETALQAVEYQSQHGRDLSEFISWARERTSGAWAHGLLSQIAALTNAQ